MNSEWYLISLLLILSFVLLSFLDHALIILLAQRALVISGGDLVPLSCAFIYSRNIERAVGINIKVTSFRGMPWGAGDMLMSSNFSSRLLSLVIAFSPSNT